MTTLTKYLLAASTTLVAAAGANADDTPMAAARNMTDLKFGPLPNVPTCMTAAVEKGDPAKTAFVVVAKAAVGCTIPWHWHTADEDLLIVGGTARMEMKDEKPVALRAGGFTHLPSHHTHQLTCTEACTLFVSSNGAFDIHYVDAKGEEITPEAALKPFKESAKPLGAR